MSSSIGAPLGQLPCVPCIFCEISCEYQFLSLTKLVDLSLQKGIFPKPFKNAIVTPLIKKTSLSKKDLKNYWPVSGLSFLSKLVEHIIAAQIGLTLTQMIVETHSSQPIKLDTQRKLPCCVSRMRYTCRCPRVCPQPHKMVFDMNKFLTTSTYQLLLTPSTMIHFSVACQQGLALLVQSLDGLQHIFSICQNWLSDFQMFQT